MPTKLRIPLARPVISKQMEEAAIHALRNERLVLGESVFKFEEDFAAFIGVKHAVSVSSGTAALQLALEALEIAGRNHRILTTPMTFIATANAILHARSVPVFADIARSTGLIDPHQISKESEQITAIIPVHLYGHPAPMNGIREIAEERNLLVVEDACQAHGAKYDGDYVGSLGDAGCFSFYSTKNLTVGGDGGMVTTNSDSVAERVRKIRDCGRAPDASAQGQRVVGLYPHGGIRPLSLLFFALTGSPLSSAENDPMIMISSVKLWGPSPSAYAFLGPFVLRLKPQGHTQAFRILSVRPLTRSSILGLMMPRESGR